MASTANNTANVSTGKGVAGGCMYVAPVGTTLPTGISSTLDQAFLNMGYLGDDGIVFADSSDVETYQDMNGDTIDTGAGAVEKTATVTLREIKKDTLAFVRGSANVTDVDGLITAKDTGPSDDNWSVVWELLLKNGRKWRRVAESVKLGELDDMTIVYNELVGRAVSVNVAKGTTTGAYYVDYIESTETEATE